MNVDDLPFRRRTVLKAVGIAGAVGTTFAARGSASEDCELSIETPVGWDDMSLDKQLKDVRNATKRYRRPAAADADGYVNTGLLGCKHGFSYGKDEPFDAVVDPRDPDILAYILSGKKLELAAVEYVVPEACGTPDVFNDEGESLATSEEDGWIVFGDARSLHVWVHADNPDGVFAPRNPDFDDMPGCVEVPDPR